MKTASIKLFIPILLVMAMIFPNMMNGQNPFQKEWKEIEKFEAQRKPASALEKLKALNAKIDGEKYPQEKVKATYKEILLANELQDESDFYVFERLEEIIPKAEQPMRSILLSFQAENLNSYLNQNIYRLQNRTEVTGEEVTDLKSMDARSIIEKIQKAYFESLAWSGLAQEKTEDYKSLINQNEGSVAYRPFLYDVLADRAVQYFNTSWSHIIKPKEEFQFTDKSAFADARSFSKATFSSKDPLSTKYKSLLLFQKWISIHLADTEPTVLIDIEQKRLSFVRNFSNIEDKDVEYLDALKKLSAKYSNHEGTAETISMIARYYSQRKNTVDGEKMDLATALEYCDQAIEKFPNALGTFDCKNLKSSIMISDASLRLEAVQLPNTSILTQVNYKNTDRVHFKLFKLDKKEYLQATNFLGQDQKLAFIKKKAHTRKWAADLPKDNDFDFHQVELEVLPIAEPGFYVIMMSGSPEFPIKDQQSTIVDFQVSNLAFLKSRDKGNHGFYVVERGSGKPIKGAQANFFLYKRDYRNQKVSYDLVGKGIADENGKIISPVEVRNSFVVEFVNGKDQLFMDNNYSNYNDNRKINNDGLEGVLFFDRKIYRPGQMVYFKGLLLERNGKQRGVKPGMETTVVFKDPNYQDIKELKLVSNEFGSFSGTFIAPSSITGSCRVEVNAGGLRFSENIQVEEYKRPSFEVKMDPIDKEYKLNSEVEVSGNAMALAGYPIDQGKVSYRVTRTTSFPYWKWGWYPYYSEPDKEIASGEVEIDKEGKFIIPFYASSDKKVEASRQAQYRYRVVVDVTDAAGETRSSETELVLGEVALSLGVKSKQTALIGDAYHVEIIAQTLNRVTTNTKGNMVIELLNSPDKIFRKREWAIPDKFKMNQSEFEQKFPNYPYKDEDKSETWTVRDQIVKQSFDTEKTKDLSFKTKNWTVGTYRLTISSKDKYGTPVELTKLFTLQEKVTKSLSGNTPLYNGPDKKTLEPGETLNLRIGSAKEYARILFELDHDGGIVERKWYSVKGIKTIDIPVKESYRGGFSYSLTTVIDNRAYSLTQKISVPWSNKELKVEFITMRNKLLPGEKETIKIKVSGPKGDKVAAEMVAAMYDASLDEFRSNDFTHSFYPGHYAYGAIGSYESFPGANSTYSIRKENYEYDTKNWRYKEYPSMRNDYYYRSQRIMYKSARGTRARSAGAPEMTMDAAVMSSAGAPPPPPPPPSPSPTFASPDGDATADSIWLVGEEDKANGKSETKPGGIQIRTNLKETVFFMPHLETDRDGNILFSFTMNEALTRWKLLTFAHTKDMKTVDTEDFVITQKDLMIQPFSPRFLREKDELVMAGKVSNLTDEKMKGTARLELLDALTMEPINDLLGNDKSSQSFTVEPKQSTALKFPITIPVGKVQAVVYRMIVESGNQSDGEENALPVLTNRMLVTETMPLAVKGGQNKQYDFERMRSTQASSTMQAHNFTLEFTSNPAWYAVQSLPYLMEYPYDCTEQIFSRVYANSLASHVANSNPKIAETFAKWRDYEPEALASNLDKNQELKSLLLEETPWVMAAQNEAAQKKNIGLLFDLVKMSEEQASNMQKLLDRQNASGGFSWFPGGRDSWYITQYLVEGFGHLRALGVMDKNPEMNQLVEKALLYIDQEFAISYREMKKRYPKYKKENHLHSMAIHYLYARSFFPEFEIKDKLALEAKDYYVAQAGKYWTELSGVYLQGMIALSLDRMDQKSLVTPILESLEERVIRNEELGAYWKYPSGYSWTQLPIETQALMIELFDEVAQDDEMVAELKVWLLKSRQTTHWKTTKGTAAAVYALLMRGDDWLIEDKPVTISFGEDLYVVSTQPVDNKDVITPSKAEAGTGYFKLNWKPEEIKEGMEKIEVDNPNKTIAWGGVYWQYFEELDKITTFEETPLKLKKQLFLEKNTPSGPKLVPITENMPIKVGDKVKVRIELSVDRAMEYVHLKDLRASGFEPINVMSSYKYQGGLGYYESTRDAATNFFIGYLSKGDYVFEYPLRASHQGDFSNGVTTIQCMYAPEFTSHSEGIRVTIEE